MSAPQKNVLGERFHHLLIIKDLGRVTYGNAVQKKKRVLCVCDCGEQVELFYTNLYSGSTKSCGCLRAPHGMSQSPEYVAWESMIQRCNKKTKHSKYQKNYISRGVTVCERWKSFINFFEDMGPRPSKRHSLDKDIKVPGNLLYSKETCMWATIKQQNNAIRRKRSV